MLTIHDIMVWDTGERIDLVVPGIDSRRLLSESGSIVSGEIDGSSMILSPGFADPHVHFRDPGQLEKETMVTGSQAAAAGGYTRVLIMPNTSPAMDGCDADVNEETGVRNALEYVQNYEWLHDVKLPVRYDVSVCASLGRAGKRPTRSSDYARFMDSAAQSRRDDDSALTKVGVAGSANTEHPLRAISDDGSAITDGILEEVLQEAKATGLPILEHCEHHDSGCINEGTVSRQLDVEGINSQTELAVVERDIEAVRQTGVHVHFQHVSTATAFDAIRQAKSEGLPVTCETAPHYLALCDEDVLEYGTMAKMNPPLRSAADRKATVAAVVDGTVDMIATDHAPHTQVEKQTGLADAPNGIIGLECAYGICRKMLVESGAIGDDRLIELMAVAPERLMGHAATDIAMLLNTSSTCATKRTLDLSAVEHPEDVDLVVIDSENEWTVDSPRFHSKGRNTPFDGWKLVGRPVATIIGTKLVFSRLSGTSGSTRMNSANDSGNNN